MNKYGQVLKDIDMGYLCDDLLNTVVNPLVRRFYPSIGKLKDTHGFIVNYDPKKQGSLDLHYDDALVTLNICLGRKFTGGKLVFHDDDGTTMATVEHKIGQAVLHLGEHQHQALKITSGQRSNIILWCRR
jgi:predicted 2-oxoglutarate/Fe(II)-dependent dioxygenase YbiX